MKLNLSTILIVLGGLGVFAPDIASVAAWLASMNIAWLGTVVKGLGLLAAFCSAAPLVVPRLRAFLALLGLATPPGAQAPWDPKLNPTVVPVPPVALVPRLTPPVGTRPGAGYPGKGGALLVFLGASLFASAALAQTTPPQALGCVDAANTFCVVPAAAVGWQVNLKTGGTANGVALLGLSLQHSFGTLPLGVGLYGGLGASNDNHGSYQGCVGISATNFGLLCVGAQHASFADNSTAWQGMLTFAGQLTFGGTPAYVVKEADKAEVKGYTKAVHASAGQ